MRMYTSHGTRGFASFKLDCFTFEMDYATKYGISEDAAAAQLQIYRRLKAERRVFTDEAAYMDRIFGCGKASSGAPAEESRTKPPATRTLDLAPVVSDEPDAEEKAAEK